MEKVPFLPSELVFCPGYHRQVLPAACVRKHVPATCPSSEQPVVPLVLNLIPAKELNQEPLSTADLGL